MSFTDKKRKRRKVPLRNLRKRIFKDRKSNQFSLIPNLNDKENNFNIMDDCNNTPEKPIKPKRVSLLNQEEDSISKKSKSKKKQKKVQSTIPAPSLLVSDGTNTDTKIEITEESDLEKIRQELQSIRNKLSTNDSPCGSPIKPRKKIHKKSRKKLNRNSKEKKIVTSPLRELNVHSNN